MKKSAAISAVCLGLLVIVFLSMYFYSKSLFAADPPPTAEVSQPYETPPEIDVPILLYHHISDILRDCTTKEKFRQDLEAIRDAGYETVFYDDLYDYVAYGKPLPDKPLVLSFDDGYLGNYEYVYPLLQEFDFCAEIAFIGALEGQTLGEDWWSEMSIYFTWEQAREMYDSGFVRIQSHTYDMHGYYSKPPKKKSLESARCPEHMNKSEFAEIFREDAAKMSALIKEHLGYEGKTFVYPLGHFDETSEAILTDLGYEITATVEPGVNRLVRGDLSTLRLLKRIGCDGFGESVTGLIEFHRTLDTTTAVDARPETGGPVEKSQPAT